MPGGQTLQATVGLNSSPGEIDLIRDLKHPPGIHSRQRKQAMIHGVGGFSTILFFNRRISFIKIGQPNHGSAK